MTEAFATDSIAEPQTEKSNRRQRQLAGRCDNHVMNAEPCSARMFAALSIVFSRPRYHDVIAPAGDNEVAGKATSRFTRVEVTAKNDVKNHIQSCRTCLTRLSR